MFHIDPDAWANLIAAVIVCVSIFNSIVKKLARRRSKANAMWYYSEVSSSVLIALVAWEMYPFVTLVHDLVPQSVYTAIAIHAGARFIQKLQDKIQP